MNDQDDTTVVEDARNAGGSGREILAGVVFIGLYHLMSIFSLIVHLWGVKRVWDLDGFWWAVLYFSLFIYAELYWAYHSFLEQGFNLFGLSCAIVGLWWFFLLLFRKRISAWCARVGGEDESSSTNLPG
jgi:hypothetical protein